MAAKGPKHKRPSVQGLEGMSNDRDTGLPLGRIIEDITGFTGPISDFVEGPEPDVPVAREIHQRLRSQCDSYSNAPSWFTGQSGGFQVGVGLVCDKYLESQGSGGPTNSPPFTGGQCDGVLYNVSAKLDYGPTDIDDTEETLVLSGQLTGPIVGFFKVRSRRRLRNSANEVYREQVRYALRCANENNEIVQTNFGSYVDVFSCDEGPPAANCTGAEGADPPVNGPYDMAVSRADGLPDNCGDLDSETGPNPNPRPNPNLDPEDEPFERAPGQPVFPMPEIENPFGEPVQLPNYPGPPIFGIENEDGSTNPNVGPPVTPGVPQDGNGTNGEDDEFGEPPEGHIWVGFVVEISDQGVSEGLQPNSPPEPIYRATTGNYRAIYDVDGETVYSSPRDIRQQTSAYFLDLAGLTLTGARVNVPSNDSYIVTPLSQPVTEEEEE